MPSVWNLTNSVEPCLSLKCCSPKGDIRLINSGGFYSKLPIVTGIQSSRKIERIEIEEPGTEYAPGVYNSVPISGDGEGGFVMDTPHSTMTKFIRVGVDGDTSDEFIKSLSMEDKTNIFAEIQKVLNSGEETPSK